MPARFDASDCPVPAWLPEGHSQTIVGARWGSHLRVSFQRERVDTPDGDFLDFDWATPGNQPVAALAAQDAEARKALVLFHGLEGSSASPYAQSIAHHFRARGWVVVVPHFRGCSGTPNRLPRAYHSGDSGDVEFMLSTARARLPRAAWYAAGVSLGGNALAKYLGESGAQAGWLAACAAVSAPLDLTAGGHNLGRGLVNREIYTRMFMRTLRNKVLDKARRFPAIIDVMRVAESRDLYEFDDAYTAPVHGFAGVADYWTRASALPWLPGIAVPTLLLNARNDPFLPGAVLPGVHQASDQVLLHQPARGGHAVFPAGRLRPHLNWLPRRLERFFTTRQ
ncbi:alpha/beta fold hydrolase [Verticiella sediminum]|uniref:Alpha/beta fold hydrolase n=1 Tax=Verticiella sediminum TaxID=1247510 RepID=A0A556AVS4_9BURK|nr:alpha/beta fold hydrolase [Verticiella sediminum]TSH97010.1 alpha/beta fold hydrolase [Verticiella sediminum]